MSLCKGKEDRSGVMWFEERRSVDDAVGVVGPLRPGVGRVEQGLSVLMLVRRVVPS